MAGSISLAGAQQFDVLGNLLGGGKIYWIQAGTTSTPQNAYYDTSLTLPLPNPYTLQADARVPFHYLADGQIKVRIIDSNGVTRFEQDNILVIGPSSGGGGGGGVDPTTVLTTGDVKSRYGTGNLTGFVRLNGRTIGSSTSGASERANADCQSLFEYLWQADANLAVSTGRGASANADWTANKTIALPDFRSRALAGLGDMGNSDNALFSGVTFTSGNATTLGSLLGASRRTLITANLPPYTPAGSVAATFGGKSVPLFANQAVSSLISGSGPVAPYDPGGAPAFSWMTSLSSTFTGTAQGGTSTAFDSVSPYGLVTIYMKL